MRFEILDADVATIFGMPFLELANPQINWQTKTIKIKHKGRLIEIPTLLDARASTFQPALSSSTPIFSNSFADLPLDNELDTAENL